MKKILSLSLALLLSVSLLAGCGSNGETQGIAGTISNSGSSALMPLAKAAAEDFMAENPDAIINITAGGSGTGLKDIAAKSVDIGSSDVYAETKLTQEQVATLQDNKVCTVTMMAVVNNGLGVDSLTTEQLIGIFTGKITNWSEVGGPDVEVFLCTRPSSSGTRAIFTQTALKGTEEVMGDVEQDNSGELVQTISTTEGAIGYLAMPYTIGNYAGKVTPVAIDGIAPTQENAYNGSYDVWGYEHMYTSKEDCQELATAFIEYMMSEEFAPSIEAMGYGATSKHTTSK